MLNIETRGAGYSYELTRVAQMIQRFTGIKVFVGSDDDIERDLKSLGDIEPHSVIAIADYSTAKSIKNISEHIIVASLGDSLTTQTDEEGNYINVSYSDVIHLVLFMAFYPDQFDRFSREYESITGSRLTLEAFNAMRQKGFYTVKPLGHRMTRRDYFHRQELLREIQTFV